MALSLPKKNVAKAEVALGEHLRRLGRAEEAIERFRSVLATADDPARRMSAAVAELTVPLVHARIGRCHVAAARRTLQRAVELHRTAGDHDLAEEVLAELARLPRPDRPGNQEVTRWGARATVTKRIVRPSRQAAAKVAGRIGVRPR